MFGVRTIEIAYRMCPWKLRNGVRRILVDEVN